jgi:hypothetical protein
VFDVLELVDVVVAGGGGGDTTSPVGILPARAVMDIRLVRATAIAKRFIFGFSFCD